MKKSMQHTQCDIQHAKIMNSDQQISKNWTQYSVTTCKWHFIWLHTDTKRRNTKSCSLSSTIDGLSKVMFCDTLLQIFLIQCLL